MSDIVEIKPAKRGGRLLIKLDDGRMLRLPPETVSDNALTVGSSVGEELFETLSAGGGRRIEDAAASLLSYREMTEGQLREKLAGKGYAEEQIDALCGDFIRWGLIDDRRYCELLAEYCAGKHMSRRGMENELYKRRVPKELWEDALSLLPPPQEAIDALLEARLRGRPADRKALESAAKYLYSRGFDSRDIKLALRERYEHLPGDDL